MNYEMKYEKYLPLGSVVMLKGGDKRVMITGFSVMQNNGKEVFDYIGCIYPEGFMFVDKMALFNHEDIVKIYCIGYSDDEAKGFNGVLKDYEVDIQEALNEMT